MYPHERSLVKDMEGKPFALLGINSDTDKEKLKKAMEEEHITWRSWWNGPGGQVVPFPPNGTSVAGQRFTYSTIRALSAINTSVLPVTKSWIRPLQSW
jgi:hypothetical protein